MISGALAFVYIYGFDKLIPSTPGKAPAKTHTLILTDFTHKPGQISYIKDIKPILDARCVTCHSGYDAPCQLLLSAYEGIARGASKQPVYNRYRLNAVSPSRLFIDETTIAGWRKKGFFPVLNEKASFPEINLNHSPMALTLNLKRLNPSPANGKLPEAIALGTDNALQCPDLDEFKDYQKNHALSGMPYGLPELTEKQLSTLLNWIQDGAKSDFKSSSSSAASTEIKKWEAFLNGSSLKQQLSARYLYEHLYSGDLHFKGQSNTEFFKLIRSKKPPGQPIDEISSIRPFDAPGVSPFYYRLRPVISTIVDKNHVVYQLDDNKMARLQELFLKSEYTVTHLPGYDQESASDPFKTFSELPVASRYKFLLDDAQFFFSGFAKGSVAIGSNVLKVIRDQFWVTFTKPQSEFDQQMTQFLADNHQYLRMPASESEAIGFAEWQKLDELQKQYLHNKDKFINNELLKQQPIDINFIWNGDGRNDNALLTVFRHHDNASVVKGLLGKPPLTAWVLDYPLFERIHYLMVAGFNVYGSSAHQTTTRLYMDLLRAEAETNFLKFMPDKERTSLYDSWYQGIDFKIFNAFRTPTFGTGKDPAISFQTADIKNEFFEKIQQQLETSKQKADLINRCQQEPCIRQGSSPEQQQADMLIHQLADLKGDAIKALPEVSLMRIRTANPGKDWVYTLIRNKNLLNVSFVFTEKLQRQPDQDTLTVVPGFLGSYPNLFFAVPVAQLQDFIKQLKRAKTEKEAERFYAQFAIRRSNPEIWQYLDWFNQKYRDEQPENAGLFDISRYENL